jgi:Zn-dependent M28 family amino/carboxypeptidase
MRPYDDALPKIPAAAISPVSADKLSRLIREQTGMKCRLTLDCETQGEVESANVIGEIRGTEKPEEVIVVSGHLDSWDKGQGAHDDGAGCMQSIEALRLIKAAGLKPKRTIRAVLFMNEENGLRGAKAYAEKERPGEKHILAIESDAGGFAPRGFGIDADSTVVPRLQRWASVLRLIDADRVAPGWGGADIGELRKKGVPCLGLKPDPQRYFDYHHSDLDTIDKVNPRELELGAIAMAIFSYIFAQEGLE